MDSKYSDFVATIEERYPDLGDDALQWLRAAGLTLDVADARDGMCQPPEKPQLLPKASNNMVAAIDGLDLPPSERDVIRRDFAEIFDLDACSRVMDAQLAEFMGLMNEPDSGLQNEPNRSMER